MKITYLANRIRLGEYECHDIIADGVYFNLYLNGGASIEKITQEAEKFLAAPFPAQRPRDVIQVISVPKTEKVSTETPAKQRPKPKKKRTTKKTKSKRRGHS